MTRRRNTALLVTLSLSALAHALTLSGGWLHLPQTSADLRPQHTLNARLQPAAPAAKPAAPAPVAKHAEKPRAARPRATVVAVAPATLTSDTPAPSWTLAAPEPVAEAETTALEVMAEAGAPTFEPVVVATTAPSTFAPEPAQIRTLPRRGRIAYDLHYFVSNSPALVGHTVQTWEASEHGYQLDSRSEPVGLARLTRFGPRVYHSSGSVTGNGLQPQNFTSNVMIRGKDDVSAARFDWSSNALQFGRSNEQKNAALPTGSQDLLSFMYQLSLAPPPRGRLQMPITNGTRFETYDIDVFDEETIDTPLGAVRALPVKQVRRPGRESIEVWLATEYRHLPVRIRVINRDGTPGGEQIATEINIGEK